MVLRTFVNFMPLKKLLGGNTLGVLTTLDVAELLIRASQLLEMCD